MSSEEIKPGYKRSEVGVIPENWTVKLLPDVSFFRSGKAHEQYISDTGRYVCVNSKFISTDGKIRKYSSSNFCPARKGDILMVMSDLPNGRALAKAYLVEQDNTYAVNQRVCALTPFGEYSSYLFYILNRSRYFLKFDDGVNQTHLLNPVFQNCPIPLPPTLEEKQAIGAALSDVDALLTKLDQLITKKRDLKQAAMQQLLTGQTRLPGFSGPWQVKRLGDVVLRCSSGATPRRNRPEFYQGNIPWITSGELKYNVITDTYEKISSEAVAVTNLSIVPKGTFLMAITGLEAEGTRGACGIVGAPAATNQSCMAIFPTRELKTEFLFHFYVLRGKELALEYCQGTKQQSYTSSIVKLLPISLPPSVTEQTAIATVLSDMDNDLSALEVRRDKTHALKQGMMQELLTGRIRLI